MGMYFRTATLASLGVVFWTATVSRPSPAAEPLPQAHAHNDYLHERPLLDALDNGFCSVEADIFLTPQGLLVAHELKAVRPERTLQSLYLDPLREHIQVNGDQVHRDGSPFYLLVDLKSEAESTYQALDKALLPYADMLTTFEQGSVRPGAVTVIVSGTTRPVATAAAQARRYAAMDGRLDDLKGDAPAHLIPWISANWTQVFKWQGNGALPPAERQKLEQIVRQAHNQGRKVRFWATPENTAMWETLLAANVDLINTDKLDQLREFLQTRAKK